MKWRKKRRQGWEGGRRNRKRHEDRRWMRRRWRKLGRGQGRKGKGMRPKGRGWRTSNGHRISVFRWTRARGKRARARLPSTAVKGRARTCVAPAASPCISSRRACECLLERHKRIAAFFSSSNDRYRTYQISWRSTDAISWSTKSSAVLAQKTWGCPLNWVLYRRNRSWSV